MYTSSNDCFISASPLSQSTFGFNRQHHPSRYHPYSRVSPSYYPTNESELYSFDDHHNHNTNATIPNYDQSIVSYDYWTTPCSSIDNEINMEQQTSMERTVAARGGGTGISRCFKRRVSANKKERRRTQSINTAFSDLRTAIPNVQPDTKLSKIKTLKLATKYIEYLMDILSKDDPLAMPSAFKAEIVKTRKDHRELIKYDHSGASRKIKGRTGWPQAVWQSELNRNEVIHLNPSGNEKLHLSSPVPPSMSLNTSPESLSNSPTLSYTSSSSSAKMNRLRPYDKPYSRK